MKQLCIYLLIAISVFNLSACSSDDKNEDIQVNNKNQLSQTVTAESITSSDGVSFTTTGAWSSVIRETLPTRSNNTPEWISITPDHGTEAGEYSITINLEANFTGEARTAVITIVCGDSKIEITIKQEATTQDGKYPSKHKKVISEIVQVLDMQSGRFVEPYTYQFKYDNYNRLREFYVLNSKREIQEKYAYSYDIKDEIRILQTDYGQDPDEISLILNDMGYAEEVIVRNNPRAAVNSFCSYNSDGYLTKITPKDPYDIEYILNWKDGKLLSTTYDDVNECLITPTYSTTGVNDKANIDLNIFFWGVGYVEGGDLLWYNNLYPKDYASLWAYALPGFLGKQSSGYVVNAKDENDYYPIYNDDGFNSLYREDEIPVIGTTTDFTYITNPNLTIVSYKFDKDGYPIELKHVQKASTFRYNGKKEPWLDYDGTHKYEEVNGKKLYYYTTYWDKKEQCNDTDTYIIKYKE